MNICVIGSGYVGLVTGACLADFGLNVVCVDKDEKKIAALKQGEIPIYEPGLGELVKKNLTEGRLSFTTDLKEGMKGSLVVFIAVGTPEGADGGADLSFVESVAAEIAESLNSYKVIVTKSTVPVGTAEKIHSIISACAKDGASFDVASNPEFLREGSAVEDFMRPNRVVIGVSSVRAADILKELYSPLYIIETPVVVTDVRTAELIKYASNAFLATKISFINEMADLCEKTGADVHMVAKAMGLDKRIGSKFLHPGPGFGGSCFPKDVSALMRIASEHGSELRIMGAVDDVNTGRTAQMVDKIREAAGSLQGLKVAVLGLTFKPNTDDIRESPAIKVIEGLLGEGALVRCYDPEGMANAKELLGSKITFCKDPYDAARGSACLVLLTEWNQFRRLDIERLKSELREPVVIDMRNIYSPESMRAQGILYTSIGRP